LGSSERNQGNIVSNQLNFILDIGRADVLNTVGESNLADTLFSQKVTNLDILSTKSDVDGEMRVHESHLVAVSLYDSNEQVFNVRADGTGTSELLTGGKPQVHADDAASFHNVTGNVLEITEKFTTRSGDLDRARLDLDFDCKGAMVKQQKKRET